MIHKVTLIKDHLPVLPENVDILLNRVAIQNWHINPPSYSNEAKPVDKFILFDLYFHEVMGETRPYGVAANDFPKEL